MLYHGDGERDSEARGFKTPQWERPSPGTWPKAENNNGSM